jgi:hypothetical protein
MMLKSRIIPICIINATSIMNCRWFWGINMISLDVHNCHKGVFNDLYIFYRNIIVLLYINRVLVQIRAKNVSNYN